MKRGAGKQTRRATAGTGRRAGPGARSEVRNQDSEADFIWSVGVECSVLPHIQVDQFEWTQHDRFWREDFRMIRETFGPVTVRYGLPWSMLEPRRGEFAW